MMVSLPSSFREFYSDCKGLRADIIVVPRMDNLWLLRSDLGPEVTLITNTCSSKFNNAFMATKKR